MDNNEITTLVLYAIDRARRISSNKAEVKLYQSEENELNAINQKELFEVLKKLEDDYKAIKVTFLPPNFQPKAIRPLYDNFGDFNYFSLLIKDKFDKLIEKLPKKALLKERTGSGHNQSQNVSWLSIEDCSLLLDGRYLIAKTRYNSVNHRAIEYIINHGKGKITSKEIMEKVKVTKSFSLLLDQLKLTGDLRRVFFDTSKDEIRFHNPVTSERLESLGIKFIRITHNKHAQ